MERVLREKSLCVCWLVADQRSKNITFFQLILCVRVYITVTVFLISLQLIKKEPVRIRGSYFTYLPFKTMRCQDQFVVLEILYWLPISTPVILLKSKRQIQPLLRIASVFQRGTNWLSLGMHQFQFQSIPILGIGRNWQELELELIGIDWNWELELVGIEIDKNWQELTGIGWNWMTQK